MKRVKKGSKVLGLDLSPPVLYDVYSMVPRPVEWGQDTTAQIWDSPMFQTTSCKRVCLVSEFSVGSRRSVGGYKSMGNLTRTGARSSELASTTPNTTMHTRRLKTPGSESLLKMNLQRLEMFDPVKLSAPVQEVATLT